MEIADQFFWPGMGADIRGFCLSCDVCQRMSAKRRVRPVPLQPLSIINEPLSRVAIDLVGLSVTTVVRRSSLQPHRPPQVCGLNLCGRSPPLYVLASGQTARNLVRTGHSVYLFLWVNYTSYWESNQPSSLHSTPVPEAVLGQIHERGAGI